MHNNIKTSLNKLFGPFLKITNISLLIAFSGVTLAAPLPAKPAEAVNTKPSSILGKVFDTSDDPIPGATVALQGPVGDHLTGVTKDDGTFELHDATSGIAYQITVIADGFEEWRSSVTVDAGQDKKLTDVKLHILAV